MATNLCKVLNIFSIWCVVDNKSPEGHIVIKEAIEQSQIGLARIEVAEYHKHLINLCTVQHLCISALLKIKGNRVDNAAQDIIYRHSSKFIVHLCHFSSDRTICVAL